MIFGGTNYGGSPAGMGGPCAEATIARAADLLLVMAHADTDTKVGLLSNLPVTPTVRPGYQIQLRLGCAPNLSWFCFKKTYQRQRRICIQMVNNIISSTVMHPVLPQSNFKCLINFSTLKLWLT